ncbi:M23 family metallopeptidase [Siminovitchia acidinfaciens]|uniref:M23 family metallopeptidase n=1 Tax=Siminovitchia acidinfaciens TaxID=2321395 RepID=A0A429XW42_9BACI|nr:M23 family metallopeptidase [Siminovitchia acidinfaciens]RST72592.1 M23 family metallopeptidase [Siminovitchia acidinfaciens]
MNFVGYRITSPYGWRTDPIRGGREFHAGIDLVKADRAPIHAFTEGHVLFAGMGSAGSGLGGYGNVVVIKGKDGCAHLYAHLVKTEVKAGMFVKKGQVIGRQGATGRVTGSHLHYEVRRKSSPKYGWTVNLEQSTFSPIEYLTSYYRQDQLIFKLEKATNGYVSAADASRRVNKKTTVRAGTYFVFNVSGEMVNVTSREGVPGNWINPGANTEKHYKKIILPKSSSSWRVYPINKKPVKGNEIGFLNPKKFGGLSYDIIGNPRNDVYTIQTANFGKVNIYAAPGTGAKVQ